MCCPAFFSILLPGSHFDTGSPPYGTEDRWQQDWHGAKPPESEMVQKIALEEHFLPPGFEGYWRSTVGNVDPKHAAKLLTALTDFGEIRLAAMARAGIARAVMGLAGPGVQVERDTATAIRNAKAANDFLAEEIAKRPDRYSGFAHLAMQDARAAADELERCMRDLKFCGAMINGHTNGQYLDHPSLYPFWERAEDLGAPIYIHPTDPITPSPALEGYSGLRRATWEWGFETGSHALRLVFGGLFDRFPRARVMLGHLGETLPFLLWRFDSRAKLYGVKLAQPPSAYIRQNIMVTTSGMCSADPLNCTISALGHEHVMFAADFPFESADEAGEFLDRVLLTERVREDIAYNNAVRHLGLVR
jgi:2,3-dihydroxybenzoate decarboxylase